MPAPDDRPAASLDGPPYPEQPVDGERPVGLRGLPERTQDPGDWDVDARESISSRGPDTTADDLALRTRADREDRAEGTTATSDDTHDEESSYSSERQQGAAQPGPDDV